MTTDRNPDCAWVLENLDAFVDHELGRPGHAAVTAHCARCGACTRELEMAIRVRKLLRTMPAFEVPARVVDAAEREIHAGTANVTALPARRVVRLVRAAAVVAAVLIVIIAGAWLMEKQRAAREQKATEADVRRATAQLALAFDYVGRYSNGVVREEVLEKRVLPPIERAISRDSAKPKTNQTGM